MLLSLVRGKLESAKHLDRLREVGDSQPFEERPAQASLLRFAKSFPDSQSVGAFNDPTRLADEGDGHGGARRNEHSNSDECGRREYS
jgi:hypothetical protein